MGRVRENGVVRIQTHHEIQILRAFLLNLQGARSNTLEYTIHCNGG
jgi:hypothetical protein